MITLYGGGPSRWVKPYWMLKELGVKFEEKNPFTDPQAMSELLKLNPQRKVPVLVEENFSLSESNAIVSFLADKYPEFNLIPKAGTFNRAKYDQWLSFSTDLEQPMWRILKHRLLYPEDKRSTADIELAKSDYRKMVETLEANYPGEYLIDNKFSAADITLTYALNWGRWENLLRDLPRLNSYVDKHTAREHFPQHLYNNKPY